IEGEDLAEEVLVPRPAAQQLRSQRGSRPRVENVRVCGEAAGHITLLFRIACRDLGDRIDGQRLGNDRIVVVRLTVAVEAVPQMNRYAEVALPGDQPVAVEVLHPVLIARAHERRVPLDLTPPGDELISQLCRPAAVADVPLTAGDDLERLVTLLIERNGMG